MAEVRRDQNSKGTRIGSATGQGNQKKTGLLNKCEPGQAEEEKQKPGLQQAEEKTIK